MVIDRGVEITQGFWLGLVAVQQFDSVHRLRKCEVGYQYRVAEWLKWLLIGKRRRYAMESRGF